MSCLPVSVHLNLSEDKITSSDQITVQKEDTFTKLYLDCLVQKNK